MFAYCRDQVIRIGRGPMAKRNNVGAQKYTKNANQNLRGGSGAAGKNKLFL